MTKQTRFNRFAAAGVIAVVAILAILAIALRRGRREPAPSRTGEGADGGSGQPTVGQRGELDAGEMPGKKLGSEPPGKATATAAQPGAEADDVPEAETAGNEAEAGDSDETSAKDD